MKPWVGRASALAWVASVALALPALRARFSLDDFLQRLVLEGKPPELGLGPASLYDFMHSLPPREFIARGYLPWHTDPQLTLRFFRPLSSLSIALDQRLFGRAELPSHLVNAAWFFAVTALAFAFFRLLLTPRRAAIAMVVFAVASGHALNVLWTAGRHVLVGGLFGALAVLGHVRNARGQTARWLPRWLAPVSLLIAAFASETSLAAAAIIASHELFATEAPPRRRLLAALPWAGAALFYVSVYAAAGYGVAHSSLYISPLSAPGAFLGAAVTRLPTLVGELSFGVPSFVWGAAAPARPALAALGTLTAALVFWLAWRASATASERRQVTWLSAATLLATLPMVGGVPDGRMLLLASFTSVPLVATALEGAFAAAAPGPLVLLRAAGLVLGLMHLPLAALLRLGVTEVMTQAAQKQYELAATADVTRCSEQSPLFVVTGADPSLCISGGTSLRYYRPELAARHPSYAVLSLAPQAQRLERVSDGRVILEVEGEPRRATMFEELFRDSPLVPGQRVVLDHFSAQVLATERGFFTRVAFALPDNACLLTIARQRLVGAPLPERGTSQTVPHEAGPLGL
jgi:hypothetical protein